MYQANIVSSFSVGKPPVLWLLCSAPGPPCTGSQQSTSAVAIMFCSRSSLYRFTTIYQCCGYYVLLQVLRVQVHNNLPVLWLLCSAPGPPCTGSQQSTSAVAIMFCSRSSVYRFTTIYQCCGYYVLLQVLRVQVHNNLPVLWLLCSAPGPPCTGSQQSTSAVAIMFCSRSSVYRFTTIYQCCGYYVLLQVLRVQVHNNLPVLWLLCSAPGPPCTGSQQSTSAVAIMFCSRSSLYRFTTIYQCCGYYVLLQVLRVQVHNNLPVLWLLCSAPGPPCTGSQQSTSAVAIMFCSRSSMYRFTTIYQCCGYYVLLKVLPVQVHNNLPVLWLLCSAPGPPCTGSQQSTSAVAIMFCSRSSMYRFTTIYQCCGYYVLLQVLHVQVHNNLPVLWLLCSAPGSPCTDSQQWGIPDCPWLLQTSAGKFLLQI